MKPGRIPCCIPFCCRTAPADKHPHATEIICGKCWRLADRRLRLVYNRRYRKAEVGDESQAPELDRLWAKLKSEIIEISGGIR